MEAKLKDFKGKPNKTYRKSKSKKKNQMTVRVILAVTNNQFTPVENIT